MGRCYIVKKDVVYLKDLDRYIFYIFKVLTKIIKVEKKIKSLKS